MSDKLPLGHTFKPQLYGPTACLKCDQPRAAHEPAPVADHPFKSPYPRLDAISSDPSRYATDPCAECGGLRAAHQPAPPAPTPDFNDLARRLASDPEYRAESEITIPPEPAAPPPCLTHGDRSPDATGPCPLCVQPAPPQDEALEIAQELEPDNVVFQQKLAAKIRVYGDKQREDGVRAVIFVRCTRHFKVAAYNHSTNGSECAACAVEDIQKLLNTEQEYAAEGWRNQATQLDRAERAESRAKELEADLAAAQERIKTLEEALRGLSDHEKFSKDYLIDYFEAARRALKAEEKGQEEKK